VYVGETIVLVIDGQMDGQRKGGQSSSYSSYGPQFYFLKCIPFF